MLGAELRGVGPCTGEGLPLGLTILVFVNDPCSSARERRRSRGKKPAVEPSSCACPIACESGGGRRLNGGLGSPNSPVSTLPTAKEAGAIRGGNC